MTNNNIKRWLVFANFAAKRHFNGPLRAVSPVVDNLAEVNWKQASLKVKQRSSCAAPVRANSTKLIQYIHSSFKGGSKQETLSFKESCQLMWVEAVSLLIPFLYIATVLCVFGFAVFFFSEPMIINLHQENYLVAAHWSCPAVLSFGFLYVLLRPIFGGFRSYHGRVLLRDEAPALFELVQEMSRYLNVRPPKRIEVNNETALRVDAYAGVNSIYRDEYKIIIGAPLLMSLSLNELSAMIAHELSHFRSKQKKVAFYLMHHVSEWLYFRASGQDKRHQELLKRMQKENVAFYEYGELWVWQRIHLVQQWIFSFLFHSHRKLTAWKCLQIELETDQEAIKVAGTASFKAMFKGLRSAQFAQKAVSSQNDWAWKEGFLLDDYAKAVALEAKKIQTSNLQAIQDSYNKSISHFCPSDAQRMAANSISEAGLLKANVAARFLVEQPYELSKELTLLDYQANHIKDAEKFCVSSDKIRALKAKKDAGIHCAKRYFDGRDSYRILKFEPTDERDVAQFDIKTSIDFIRNNRVEDRKQNTVALNLFKRIEKTYIVERLRASKLPVHRYLPQEVASKKDAQAYLEYMQQQYANAVKKMEEMDQVFYQRAHECMNLLDHQSRSKVVHSFLNLELYCQVRHLVAQLKLSNRPLTLIVNGLHNGASTRVLQAGANEKQRVWDILHTLRQELQQRPIQVSIHSKPAHIMTYLDYKLSKLPERSTQMSIMAMAEYLDQFIQLLDFQCHKWQGQLAVMFTQFEHGNGIAQVNLLNRY
ncbi:MAG: Zn-dependent protease with chaperone function [Oceanicoccus sp.]